MGVSGAGGDLSVMAMWMYLGSFSPPSRLAQEEYAPPRLLTVRLPPGCSAAPVRQLLPFRPPPPRLCRPKGKSGVSNAAWGRRGSRPS